jgi:hypothetical protein
MKLVHTCIQVAATGLVTLTMLSAAASAQTVTHRPAYGCFKVTVPELNIRAKALSSSAVLATVIKGETLVKRHRFCALRGYWCAVTTNKGIQGFADKSMMAVAPCPSRLAN